MANRAFILLGLALCWGQVLAGGYKPTEPSQYCFYSIYTSLSKLKWSDGNHSASHRRELSQYQADASLIPHVLDTRSTAKPSTQCTVTSEVTSLYASAKLYCSPEELADGIVYWKALCHSVSATLMDLTNISTTVTTNYIETLPTIDPGSGAKSATAPAVLAHAYYKRALKSWLISVNATPQSKRFGWGLMGFWGGVITLGILTNIWNTISSRSAKRRSWGPLKPLAIVCHLIRTHVVIPAAFKSHHQQRFLWCTIPKRLDFLIVFGFWSLCIILSCVNYRAFSENTLYATVALQIWNWMPVRMGIFAYCCLPWLWMFAGRNNIFIWATGWSYRTFSIFHRHIARAATVFAIVHSIGYTVKYTRYSPGTYTTDMKLHWFLLGIVATILMCLLLAFSSTWLRVKFYEVFLLVHITFCIALVIALFVHTSKQDGEYNGYLWPVVAIWSFDRAARIARILYCNFRVRFSSQIIKTSSSVVSYDKAQDVIRIDVYPGSSTLKPAPGQYYHLYQPFTLRGWENHPFTLGAFSTVSKDEGTPQVFQDVEKSAETVVQTVRFDDDCDIQSSTTETKLTFWVRPYDGWTKRLRDQCVKSDGSIRKKLLIEGPYGHREPLHKFDTVVLITGGTGIASALPYILDHTRASSSQKTTTKIKLFCATRQEAFIHGICHGEMAPALRRSDFEANFYCTSGNHSKGSNSPASIGSSDDDFDNDKIAPVESKTAGGSTTIVSRPIEIHRGRPDISKIVADAALEAKATETSVVVLVCGPALMADETRAAVQTALKQGCHSMEYVEDTFGW